MNQLADHSLTLQGPLGLQVASNIFWAYKTFGILRKDMIKQLSSLVPLEQELPGASAKGLGLLCTILLPLVIASGWMCTASRS